MKNKQVELIKQLTDKDLVKQLFITQVLLLVFSVLIGGFLFKDIPTFLRLFSLDLTILQIGIPAGLAVVLIDIAMMKLLPDSYQDDGGVNNRIFTSLSYPMIIIFSLIVAISEELLFRGVLQTHIGLFWTSLLFALIHYRYLFNPFLLINIIALSFILGYLFELSGNLYVTIMMHFIIDCMLGLIIKITNGTTLYEKRRES